MSISRLVSSVWGRVCVLGLSVSIFPERGSWASGLFFASLGRSATIFVRWMYPEPVVLAGVRPPRCALWNRRCCSRATCNRRCLICVRLCCYTRAAAACSALCAVCCFRWIGEWWGVSVPVIGIAPFWGGFASELASEPASTSASEPASEPARQRARQRGPASKPRLDSNR